MQSWFSLRGGRERGKAKRSEKGKWEDRRERRFNWRKGKKIREERLPCKEFTMVENRKKHRQNSHPIIHCPTSEAVSEVRERANE